MSSETCLSERIAARSIGKTSHMRMARAFMTGAYVAQPFCSMESLRVHVMFMSGDACMTLGLPRGMTIWHLKTLVRALRGLPRTSQHMFVGEKSASAGHTLGSFSTDPLFVTLVQSRPGCAFCKDDARKLKRCGACNDVYYCGPLCQAFDWPRHRIVCRSNDS